MVDTVLLPRVALAKCVGERRTSRCCERRRDEKVTTRSSIRVRYDDRGRDQDRDRNQDRRDDYPERRPDRKRARNGDRDRHDDRRYDDRHH